MINPKIQCIMRYLEKNGYDEIAEYLLSNKLAVSTDLRAAVHLQERAELILVSLTKAQKEEKLLLLDFEWRILPMEQIKITCVSPREEKLFTYGY